MALKDWKKTRQNKDGIRWARRDDPNAIIFVHTLKKKNGFMKDIIIFEEYKGIDKTFKTKSQAIAYAKKYMGSH